MKLYAIRDKLIDYFLRPFTAENDKEVMASLAETINNDQNKAPIAQTPSHFEIWILAEVDGETGIVIPKKEFLGDASSLVRPNIREGVNGRREAVNRAAGGEQRAAGRPNGSTSAHAGAVPDKAPAEDGQGGEVPQGHSGSPELDKTN